MWSVTLADTKGMEEEVLTYSCERQREETTTQVRGKFTVGDF